MPYYRVSKFENNNLVFKTTVEAATAEKAIAKYSYDTGALLKDLRAHPTKFMRK